MLLESSTESLGRCVVLLEGCVAQASFAIATGCYQQLGE